VEVLQIFISLCRTKSAIPGGFFIHPDQNNYMAKGKGFHISDRSAGIVSVICFLILIIPALLILVALLAGYFEIMGMVAIIEALAMIVFVYTAYKTLFKRKKLTASDRAFFEIALLLMLTVISIFLIFFISFW
jgi:hypothetical protein